MDLTQIQNPSFLKDMSISELEGLSEDIRKFLIEELSQTGGHIAPNLCSRTHNCSAQII